MNLPFRIAWRYLFAKKSHNVINVISWISAAGMAVGTAALVIILSIFGGFDSLVRENLGSLESDYEIQPSSGSFFEAPQAFRAGGIPKIADTEISEVIRLQAFAVYGDSQSVVNLIGVGPDYEYELEKEGVYYARLGSALASALKANPRFSQELVLYFPSRDSKTLTSQRSLRYIKAYPADTFTVSPEVDAATIILPASAVRNLAELSPKEVSALRVNLKASDGTRRGTMAVKRFGRSLRGTLSDGFVLKDRYEQNSTVYKMMRYEKLAVYAVLVFVLIIIAFNIFGSLSLLILDKKEDVDTLKAMGATGTSVRRIFLLEGWLVSLVGLASGLVIGVGFCLLQQHFGFIQMPGNFITAAYPVVINPLDILVISAIVAAVGFLVALLPVRHYSDSLK